MIKKLRLGAVTFLLALSLFQPAGAATHPLARNGTHFCGVSDGWTNKRHSDQFPNRHYAQSAVANLNVGEPRTIYIPDPVPPSTTIRDAFELDSFYSQWIDVEGFPVLASAKVNPYALKESAWLIWQMIGHRPDVLQALVETKARFIVIGHTEMTTDIPEYSHLRPKFFHNRRGRAFGGWACSANEENVLEYPGHGWSGYSVLIHEFAHTIHLVGLDTVDPTFDSRLKNAYHTAIEKGLWLGTYASTNRREYWAEGTIAWFNVREFYDDSGLTVNTRAALENV